MAKDKKEVATIICDSLQKGNGRVVSVDAAGISYETFLDWMNTESPRFDSEFSEAIKKAERVKSVTIKETCEAQIFKAATDKEKPIWQAAAWILERKYPSEYGLKNENTPEDKPTTINITFPDSFKQLPSSEAEIEKERKPKSE